VAFGIRAPLLYFPRSSLGMALTCRGFWALALGIASVAAQNSTTNSTADANYDVLTYVNQLIGSSNGGLSIHRELY
jgi:hypothetical protein